MPITDIFKKSKTVEPTLGQIKFKLTDEKPCQVTFSVNVPAGLVEAKEAGVAKEYQKAARLPGFRPGKAPMELVRKNFAERVKGQTVEELLKDSVSHVLREKELTPVSTPLVDKIKLDDKSGALSFHLIVERSPEFEPKGYQKIPLQKKVKNVSDADVQKELDELRERNAQLAESKAGKVEKSHYAVIDYAGELEGKALPELKAENQLIDLSAPQTIAGFAEGVLGAAKGETKDVPIQFPGQYPDKKLAGKSAVFKVTVRDIKEKAVPNLDDEFAKDLGLASLEELKGRIRESLQTWADKNARADQEKQVYDHLVKENPIPVPESLVNMQLESMVDQAVSGQSNRPAGETDSPEKMEERKKTLREKFKPQAERVVRLSYLISRIAKKESLKAGDEDLKKELESAEQGNPGRADEVKAYFKENESRILNQLTEEKVLKFLIEHAKIKEVQE